MIIGLTGSSGSGKSTVAEMFKRAGWQVVDCDKISREIDSDPEYISAVIDNFGAQVIDKNGKIDRRTLGKIVFSDKEKLGTLTNISHPIIIGKVLDIIKASGNYVIDAPLLFESGLDRECDTTIGVICGDEKRATRVAKRDGIDLRYAEMRTSSQKNVDFYREKCVCIIENDGSVADLEKKVKTLLSGLEK